MVENTETSILEYLTTIPITTSELQKKYVLLDQHCPDDLVKILMKMRKKGRIEGTFSINEGGWVWWKK
ncbi:MAG: hypothetical protein LUQ39_01775 [Methanomassiliicoccales archaeon]|nr:hypothetical protein [Methanomassiliicoccales archaeon]